MQVLNVWDDISKYKKCRKKQYTVHVCMPPKGTVVINKIRASYEVKMLGGERESDTINKGCYLDISPFGLADSINKELSTLFYSTKKYSQYMG